MALPQAASALKRPSKTPPSAPGTPTVLPLHQRILFPPSSSARPPRILHSAAHTTLDPLILDLIALSLRAYVTPWYNGGISRDPERAFLQAVAAVLVHVVQALEVRLATVDWAHLLARDVPELVAAHYRDWDLANQRAGSGSAHNLSPEQLFHNLQPHIAISLASAPIASSSSKASVPHVDKVYLGTLVDHLLRLLLPPEDYRAETERGIVREMFVGVVFGAVLNRVAQPWFLHGIIARQLEAAEAARRASAADALAGVADKASRPTGGVDKVAVALISIPARLLSLISAVSTFSSSSLPTDAAARPPLYPSLLGLVSAVLPYSAFLATFLSLVSVPLAFLSTRLDWWLARSVDRAMSASTVRGIVEGAVRGMFPCDGWPATKEDDPDDEAQEALRLRCEEALARSLPDAFPILVLTSLATDEPNPRLALARHVLRPLSSHVANVHLFVLLIDLVVGRLFPELVVPPAE
ncbi:PXA domain-containing protein [Rhodotorula diobovata]|uniref:PXA domain-containing protein n=1 Tax=Rhodotorula diobovata TaxID=5288 RepID=A0A5C5G1H1_9BASI|nr:PXA domain-containing protein [Rhodotorula diobovata]